MARVATKPTGMSRRMEMRLTSMGQTRALTPKISKIFIVLLPIMLPIAKPGLPFAHENTLTIISGNEVPKATMVRPMIRGDSLARMPTLVAPLTSQFAPKIRATKPAASNKRGIKEVISLSWRRFDGLNDLGFHVLSRSLSLSKGRIKHYSFLLRKSCCPPSPKLLLLQRQSDSRRTCPSKSA